MSAGWEALNAAVAEARAIIAAAAPDPALAAEGQAYVARVLTACLNDAFLGHLMCDGGLFRALPTRGGPNPDYLMSHAPIDPARRYRIEGRLNDSERVGVGLYSFGKMGAADLSAYAAFDAVTADDEGRFSLEIASDAAGPGTLAIQPDARVLIVRILHRDPAGQPARVVLTGGPPVADLGLMRGSADGALEHAAQVMLSTVRQFLEWSAVTSAAPNRFLAEAPNLSQGVIGDADTTYYLGYYDLAEGEWLEAVMPPGIPGYWSLHAYNHWCEPLPRAGAHDRNTRCEPDGGIQIVIGPNPPADAPNRIETVGRRRGLLVCRIIGAPDVGPPLATLRRA